MFRSFNLSSATRIFSSDCSSSQLSIPSGLDPNFISYDKQVVEAYINDPLVENKLTSRLASEMFVSLPGMIPAATKLKIPTMMQLGSEDEAFHPDSWVALFDAIAIEDKVFKKYDGFRHETYNEVKKELPLGDLKDWLNKHN